jgi:hypothetical protein
MKYYLLSYFIYNNIYIYIYTHKSIYVYQYYVAKNIVNQNILNILILFGCIIHNFLSCMDSKNDY